MSTWLVALLFALGLGMLLVGANLFVDSSLSIARRLHLSDLVIGATLVSLGTTLPELLVSTTASLTGHSDLALGSAVGSALCNTALLGGLTLLFQPQSVDRKVMLRGGIFFFLALMTVSIFSWQGLMTRWAGLGLICMFGLYLMLVTRTSPDLPPVSGQERLLWVVVKLFVGTWLLSCGATMLVDQGTALAAGMGVSERVLALTLVAVGTSLPELFVMAAALLKRRGGLSLGNLMGASILNLTLVLGAGAAASPLVMTQPALEIDLPIVAGAMAMLLLPALVGKRTYRIQGLALLALYAAFLWMLV